MAGDAVNTAARVQAAADPGSVLVDGPTQRLAERGIGFADAGEHALKGKAEPQRLWRATRVLAGVGGSQRVDGLEAPLIGRDAELRTVTGAVPRRGRAAGAAAGAGVGAGGGGQVAAGLGVREVHRRPGGGGVVASGPVPVLRGGGGVLGAGRDGAAAACHRRGRPRRGGGRQAGRRAGPVRPRSRRSGPMSGRGWAGCSASLSPEDGGAPLGREELFAGWRLFFERLAAEGSRWCCWSRTPSTPTRGCWISWTI